MSVWEREAMAVLTTREAADLLGVSGATVRNWCRAGYLPASSDCPLAFDADEVAALKERIRTNRFNRLRKRANKSASEKTPAAAPQDAQLLADLSRFRNLLAEAETDPGSFLYGVTLRYLKLMDEAVFPDAPHLDVRNVAWRRTAIGKIMLGWRERVAGPVAWPHARDIDSLLDVGPEADRLGVLYQHLSSVGAKARGGVFFTPNRIIDDSLTDLGVIPDSFLDPCCGTGRYLMRAADRFGLDPRRIFGYDSDPVAVDIARLNLLLMYQDADFIPHVYCLDSLRDLANGDAGCETNHLLGGVHAIATNPPWGCRGTMLHNRKRVEAVRSGESFSLFLEKSLRLLRQ